MKKLSVLAFIFIFSSTFLFSLPNFSDTKQWVPTTVLLGTGNDKWTFGFSRNNDDQLSYSINAKVEAPIWKFSLDVNGITNRGWKEAWTESKRDNNENEWYDGRYDVYDFGFALKLPLTDNTIFNFTVTPEIGFVLAGDYGFVYFQNLVHHISKIHEVHIAYDDNGKQLVAPKLSISSYFSAIFPLTQDGTKIGASLYFEADNNIGFETTQYLGSDLFIYQKEKPIISLSIGHLWMQAYTGWKTQELFHYFNSGWRAGLKLNIGAFAIDYYKVLESSFGYNIYSIDMMSFFEESTYKASDLILSLGFSRVDKRNYNSIQLQKDISNSNFSVISTSRYIAGNPISPKDEAVANLHEDWRLKLAYASWALGINYDFPDSWSKGWLTPYVNTSLGIYRFELAVLTNMLASSPVPLNEVHDYLFFFDFEIGLSLLPSGLLKAENATYRLFFSYGLSYFPNSEKLTNYIDISHLNDFFGYDFTREHYILNRITLGITIGLDL